jgi:two-component system CheB/CheR fusion protein
VAPAETVGRLVYDLGNRQWDIPLLRALLEEVLPQKSVVDDFEITHTFEDLAARTILVNARQLNTSNLILVGFRDVTALKQVEQSLREADRRKDEFLATLAHELRNPLAAMTAAVAVQRKSTPQVAAHSQDILERQTAHLARLVDDLLDISRITRGKVDLRRKRTELNTLVRETVASVPRPNATCDIRTTADSDPIYAFVDSHRIAQVITNLINNACHRRTMAASPCP